MNAYFSVIITAVIAEYIISLIVTWLNLRRLANAPPEELVDVYDGKEYRRSQEYTVTRTRLGITETSLQLAILLIFWFIGGFNYLDQIVSQSASVAVLQGVIFIGILSFSAALISLPFDMYGTFVIEEKFGFNMTRLRTFVADRLKGVGLGLVIGLPLLSGILILFELGGSAAWLWCWAATAIFTLAMHFVIPVWVMPLFNEFTPLSDGGLKDAIFKYGRSVNFSISNIFVIDGSRRSSHSNAFFTGFGSAKRVVLFDTLIESHTEDEIVAVVAHEVGHYKKRHIITGTIISVLHVGLLFFLLSQFLHNPGLHEAFFMDHVTIYAGIVFFGLLYKPVELILSLAMHGISRLNETQADIWAVDTLEQPEALASGLKRLAAKNLTNLDPHPLEVIVNHSHPPLAQRLQAIQGRLDTAALARVTGIRNKGRNV